MVLLNSRRKVLVVLVSLVLSSLLCLIVVYRRRRTEKLTDYHFLKDDNRLAGHHRHTLTPVWAGSSGTRSTWTLLGPSESKFKKILLALKGGIHNLLLTT